MANSSVPVGGISPIGFSRAVVSRLIEEGRLRAETLAQVCPVIENFGRFVEIGLGIRRIQDVEAEHARAFLDSRQPSGIEATFGSRRVRRKAVRTAFRIGRALGLVRGDPTLDLDLGPTAHQADWPLTDAQVERCREYAISHRRDKRRPPAWALSEATARTSEIALVRVGDVDLDRSRVWLPGSSTTDPRWGPLSAWAQVQLGRRLAQESNSDAPLVVWRSTPKEPRAASSQAVVETLRLAGVDGPGIGPRSITAWAGRRALLDGATIEEVARLLGMRSLDQAAAFIGHDWRGRG